MFLKLLKEFLSLEQELIGYLNFFQIQARLFLSSAAVALGGLSVSIIGSGIGQLGEFLWELISGENKQQLIKRFNEEKENWEKIKKAIMSSRIFLKIL